MIHVPIVSKEGTFCGKIHSSLKWGLRWHGKDKWALIALTTRHSSSLLSTNREPHISLSRHLTLETGRDCKWDVSCVHISREQKGGREEDLGGTSWYFWAWINNESLADIVNILHYSSSVFTSAQSRTSVCFWIDNLRGNKQIWLSNFQIKYDLVWLKQRITSDFANWGANHFTLLMAKHIKLVNTC